MSWFKSIEGLFFDIKHPTKQERCHFKLLNEGKVKVTEAKFLKKALET